MFSLFSLSGRPLRKPPRQVAVAVKTPYPQWRGRPESLFLIWLWWSKPLNGIPFWLVGEFTIHFRTYSSGWIGCSLGVRFGFHPEAPGAFTGTPERKGEPISKATDLVPKTCPSWWYHCSWHVSHNQNPVQNLVAVDPSAKSLTFCGLSGQLLDFPKS